jgi:hypothetical protein
MLLLLVIAPACLSQDPPQERPVSSRPDSNEGKQERDKPMLGIMPGYGIVQPGSHPPPLTSGQKFKLALQYIHPYTFVFVGLEAAVAQGLDSPHEYGQGAEGYGKRYGAAFADGLTNTVFVTGFYPSLLHQDPRFYRQGYGTVMNRGVYAFSRIFITRQDSGRKTFNFSEVFGNFTAGAVSTAYYPDSQRNIGNVAQHAAVQMGYDAGFNILKEFYPDIRRKLSRKKQ